jgi:hypothetical protein
MPEHRPSERDRRRTCSPWTQFEGLHFTRNLDRCMCLLHLDEKYLQIDDNSLTIPRRNPPTISRSSSRRAPIQASPWMVRGPPF